MSLSALGTLQQLRNLLPRQKRYIFLSYCSVSPLHPIAHRQIIKFHQAHARDGLPDLLSYFQNHRAQFSQAFATLLKTSPENISAIHSTAAGCNILASDYPLQPGDHLLVYEHEYPSNFYPWYLAAQRRGAQLELLPDTNHPSDLPHSFTVDAIRQRMTPRTRMLCLSHVQFANGFCCELEDIATLCQERGVDFILDATQSLGALPVYPEPLGLAAVISSGWKWLLGPAGIGVLYTTAPFRDKLEFSHGGPAMMQQGFADLLDLGWTPHTDGRRFEYSTIPAAYTNALATLVNEVFLVEGIESIANRIRAHQEHFRQGLDASLFDILEFSESHQSTILAFNPKRLSTQKCCDLLQANGVFLTARGGYVRFAPHFSTSEQEVAKAIELLNKLAR